MQNFMKTILSAVQTWTKGKIKDSTADWNQNDSSADNYVKNRTHYDSRKTEEINIDFDGVLDGKEYLDLNGDGSWYLVKVSDLTPSVEEVVGGTFSAAENGEVIEVVEITEDLIAQSSHTLYVINNGDITIALENIDLGGGLMFSKGVWFGMEPATDEFPSFYFSNLSYTKESGELKKLDPKYLNLPTNLATTDDVQVAVDAASAAQSTADTAVANAATAQSTADAKMDATNPVGTGSFSMNRKSGTTVGAYSHAEGSVTTASGFCSHAEGQVTTASGSYSHAEGYNTTASGNHSHAEGQVTTASGDSSHTEGYNTIASGNYSHAEGYNTTASDPHSHAEGNGTTASGDSSHAEGQVTTASGSYSHAEGYNTTASGNHSHAEGNGTTAYGYFSHAEGNGTTARKKSQHVQGEFNILDDAVGMSNMRGKYAHIVGNGTSDTARSNAHTLDWDGNGWFQGDVYVGSTSGTNMDDGSKKLATEEYVSTLVGDTNVATQISNAVAQKSQVQIITWEADD